MDNNFYDMDIEDKFSMSNDQNPDWWGGEPVSRTEIITISNDQNPDWWGGEPVSRTTIITIINGQNPDW